MHILMLVAIGLAVLAGFYFAAGALFGKDRGATGARAFIGVWLLSAIVNGIVGVVHAGIPVLNEIAAFVPIFGIPAAAAWYLSHRR